MVLTQNTPKDLIQMKELIYIYISNHQINERTKKKLNSGENTGNEITYVVGKSHNHCTFGLHLYYQEEESINHINTK